MITLFVFMIILLLGIVGMAIRLSWGLIRQTFRRRIVWQPARYGLKMPGDHPAYICPIE